MHLGVNVLPEDIWHTDCSSQGWTINILILWQSGQNVALFDMHYKTISVYLMVKAVMSVIADDKLDLRGLIVQEIVPYSYHFVKKLSQKYCKALKPVVDS